MFEMKLNIIVLAGALVLNPLIMSIGLFLLIIEEGQSLEIISTLNC